MGLGNLFSFAGILAILLDVGDFFIGSVPVVGIAWDAIATIFCIVNFGGKSSIAAILENIPSETLAIGPGTAIEAIVPSCTISAIMAPDKVKY